MLQIVFLKMALVLVAYDFFVFAEFLTKQFGTPAMEQTYSLAIDGNDNIIVGGGTFGSFPGFTNFGQVYSKIR